MAILKKINAIEITIIVLASIFLITMVAIIALEELGYINTFAGKCSNVCIDINKTAHTNGDSCICCDAATKKIDYGTSVETNCFKVDLNEK